MIGHVESRYICDPVLTDSLHQVPQTGMSWYMVRTSRFGPHCHQTRSDHLHELISVDLKCHVTRTEMIQMSKDGGLSFLVLRSRFTLSFLEIQNFQGICPHTPLFFRLRVVVLQSGRRVR